MHRLTSDESQVGCRHTTSKIAHLADFDRVETHGFRCEALANVAAVSRLEVQTRAAESVPATKTWLYGKMTLLSQSDENMQQGTTVTVNESPPREE